MHLLFIGAALHTTFPRQCCVDAETLIYVIKSYAKNAQAMIDFDHTIEFFSSVKLLYRFV